MMAAGLRATAKALEYPPEPKVGAPVLDPTEPMDTELSSAVTTITSKGVRDDRCIRNISLRRQFR
jgi:hypothetical protein